MLRETQWSNIAEIDLAYTAGIIDGEGAIEIARRKTPKPAGYLYNLVVEVRMIQPEVPLWLKRTFGGGLVYYLPKGNRKLVYEWNINTNKAGTFLKLILPYLKIKKPEAEIALEFQVMKHRMIGKYHTHSPKPLAVRQAEAILAQKLKGLHTKGRQIRIPVPQE